jgi:NADH-quinone oxidoreductase subunit I
VENGPYHLGDDRAHHGWHHHRDYGICNYNDRHREQGPCSGRQICEIGFHNGCLIDEYEHPRGKVPSTWVLGGRVPGGRQLVERWYPKPVMGMASLLRKVLLVDLLQGLKVTFRYQDPKEIYTEQYPLERPQVAERYRGAPRLNVNPDTNETMCIACDLCALACPENLIVVSSARNEQTRRKELTNFTYDLSRCMFCGLCEDACPVDALELTQDFELASYSREGWIWDRETLEKGPQPTQYRK